MSGRAALRSAATKGGTFSDGIVARLATMTFEKVPRFARDDALVAALRRPPSEGLLPTASFLRPDSWFPPA
jgi:hypothetical protein